MWTRGSGRQLGDRAEAIDKLNGGPQLMKASVGEPVRADRANNPVIRGEELVVMGKQVGEICGGVKGIAVSCSNRVVGERAVRDTMPKEVEAMEKAGGRQTMGPW